MTTLRGVGVLSYSVLLAGCFLYGGPFDKTPKCPHPGATQIAKCYYKLEITKKTMEEGANKAKLSGKVPEDVVERHTHNSYWRLDWEVFKAAAYPFFEYNFTVTGDPSSLKDINIKGHYFFVSMPDSPDPSELKFLPNEDLCKRREVLAKNIEDYRKLVPDDKNEYRKPIDTVFPKWVLDECPNLKALAAS